MDHRNSNSGNGAEFVIEDNIPIPARRMQKKKEKYPFSKLKVGQSFLIPGVRTNDVAWRVNDAKHKLMRHFTLRAEENGVRVWRV